MSKNRTGLYLGLAAAGAGGYYLYRAGGNPKVAKEELKHDATRIRDQAPGTEQAERAGQKAGLETNLNIDEAANNPRTKPRDLSAEAKEIEAQAKGLSAQAKDLTSEGIKRLDEGASKVRSEVEEKAAEAKGTVSGWFGGKK